MPDLPHFEMHGAYHCIFARVRPAHLLDPSTRTSTKEPRPQLTPYSSRADSDDQR